MARKKSRSAIHRLFRYYALRQLKKGDDLAAATGHWHVGRMMIDPAKQSLMHVRSESLTVNIAVSIAERH